MSGDNQNPFNFLSISFIDRRLTLVSERVTYRDAALPPPKKRQKSCDGGVKQWEVGK